MNKNLKQENDGTESWQETPYVSRFTAEMIKELTRLDLKARVAMKAFAVVGIGLLISAITSYLVSPYYSELYEGFLFFLGGQLLFMCIIGRVIGRDCLLLAGVVYLAYSINTGITFSVLFRVLHSDVIDEAFLMASVVFGVMATIGYFTKKDLSTVGGIYGTVVVGGGLVTVFNFLVFHRSGFQLFMEYVIVLLFVGIIAYNMTGLRKTLSEGGEENENRIALFMGMQLYVNFMNVFIWLANLIDRLIGGSKRK